MCGSLGAFLSVTYYLLVDWEKKKYGLFVFGAILLQ